MMLCQFGHSLFIKTGILLLMSYIVSDKDDYETFDNDDSESNYDFED